MLVLLRQRQQLVVHAGAMQADAVRCGDHPGQGSRCPICQGRECAWRGLVRWGSTSYAALIRVEPTRMGHGCELQRNPCCVAAGLADHAGVFAYRSHCAFFALLAATLPAACMQSRASVKCRSQPNKVRGAGHGPCVCRLHCDASPGAGSRGRGGGWRALWDRSPCGAAPFPLHACRRWPWQPAPPPSLLRRSPGRALKPRHSLTRTSCCKHWTARRPTRLHPTGASPVHRTAELTLQSPDDHVHCKGGRGQAARV